MKASLPHSIHKLTEQHHPVKLAMSHLHLKTKVAIAGITGRLGQLIAKHLLSYDHVEVHGIARNPDKLPDDLKSNPRLKLFRCYSMSNVTSLREAVKHCSILISTVLSDPKTELTMQKAMIDACIDEHVPRFMPNEFTLDWRRLDLDLIPQKKVNQEIFEYLDHHKDKISGVHVLIGIFMETAFSAGFWFSPDKSPAEGLSTWGSGDEIWEMTSYDNAARWTAAIALDKKSIGFIRLLGDRLSVKEVGKTLQEVYDLPPVSFTSKGSLEDLKKDVERGLQDKPNSDNFWDWKAQSYTLFLTNGQAFLELPLSNQVYGDLVEQQTLENWLESKKLEEFSKTDSF